jgi:hypothetical protein
MEKQIPPSYSRFFHQGTPVQDSSTPKCER